MNILITGANGFLGSNLVKCFIKSNNNIFAISQSDKNIKQFKDKIIFESNTKFDYFDLKGKILRFNPDIIVHCAWSGGNSYNDINKLDQYYHNISLSLSLLEIAKECKLSRFIGIGSFAEYGIITERAKETQSDNPNTHYGLSKSYFKSISKMFCDQHDISWSWIRPCYVYGSGDVATRLIPSVISKLKNNEKITLSSCNVIIDYLHVDDFCSGVYSVIDNQLDGIYNVCSGNEYNLKYILNFLQEKSKSTQLINYDSSLDRSYASQYICGSSDKLQSLTNWKPKNILEIQMEKLINE